MSIFKRKASTNSSTLVNVEEIYVATTIITSKCNDGACLKPKCITWYFLVKLENNEYHELLTGKNMEKVETTQKDDMVIVNFDTPYIKKIEPLTAYIRDKTKRKISIQVLFEFIMNMNVLNSLGAFKDEQVNEETKN